MEEEGKGKELCDYRLKTNVVNLTNQLQKLIQLRPISYTHMWDPGVTKEGFLAHELAALYPECVNGAKDAVDGAGNPLYQSVNVSISLIASIIATLKELNSSFSSLLADFTAVKADYLSVKTDYLAVKADFQQVKADFLWHRSKPIALAHPLV